MQYASMSSKPMFNMATLLSFVTEAGRRTPWRVLGLYKFFRALDAICTFMHTHTYIEPRPSFFALAGRCRLEELHQEHLTGKGEHLAEAMLQ